MKQTMNDKERFESKCLINPSIQLSDKYKISRVVLKNQKSNTLKCSYAKSRRQAPTTPLGIFSRLTYETKNTI